MADINVAAITGRLTRDPELRALTDGTTTCSFTVACNRPKKRDAEDSEADFIQCVAWRQTADYLTKYGRQGDKVELSGRIRTRSYDSRDGQRVYVTEIQVDNLTLAPKGERSETTYRTPHMGESVKRSEFQPQDMSGLPGIDGDELPF